MSSQEYEPPQQVSKFKVIRNAKGDPQWEITVVAGDTQEQLTALRQIAVAQYKALTQDLGVALAGSVKP